MPTVTIYLPHGKKPDEIGEFFTLLGQQAPEFNTVHMADAPPVPLTGREIRVFTFDKPFKKQSWQALQNAVEAGHFIRVEFEGIKEGSSENVKASIGRPFFLAMY